MRLLWNPWRGIPQAYRICVAMPPLPQLKAAPGTIRIAVSLVRSCEPQCPGALLILRCQTDHGHHGWIEQHLANRGGDLISQTIQAQRYGLIENEVGREEPSLERLEHVADALMVRIFAVGIRKPGTGIDK